MVILLLLRIVAGKALLIRRKQQFSLGKSSAVSYRKNCKTIATSVATTVDGNPPGKAGFLFLP
jgi:hypothetical protein